MTGQERATGVMLTHRAAGTKTHECSHQTYSRQGNSMINVELLTRTLQHIKDNMRGWNQSDWRLVMTDDEGLPEIETMCGTAMCFQPRMLSLMCCRAPAGPRRRSSPAASRSDSSRACCP